ncbi:MAG: hypothetical protein GEU73_00450 [Chloroflexi bacterium]|nr:hypothetical protein [Chloroflexota bacterium]
MGLFEDVTVDISLVDPVIAEPDLLRGPSLLDFADIAPIQVPTLPLALHIADKVHAYTRQHNGRPSSRVKDLVDLALISKHLAVRAGDLRHALETIFAGYDTHSLPTALPPPPALWETAYRALVAEVGLEPEVSAGYADACTFLDPVLAHAVSDERIWDPHKQTWVTEHP